MKKTILALMSFILLTTACQKEQTGETLVVAHMGEMQSLDPVFSYDGVTQGMMINVYDTLLKFKGSSMTEFLPSVSEQVPSVENGLISQDGLTYTFPIRKGIQFHDGTELTPEDVRYSLLRFMLSDVAGGPSSLLLEPILGVTSTRDEKGHINIDFKEAEKAVRVDGQNVIITLKKPFAPFLGIVARWGYITPKEWVASHGGWDGTEKLWKDFNNFEKQDSYLFDHMNGSGPFKLVRWDISGRKLLLEANENYFEGAPKIKNIHMMTISEPSTMRLLLEGGEADIAEVPVQFAAQMKDKSGVVVYDNLPRLRTDPVVFFTRNINTAGNPDVGSGQLDGKGIPSDFFADADVRKGFAYAFNYDSFLRQAMEGRAERAYGPAPAQLVPQAAGAAHYEFDLKKAKEHFQKAYGGKLWDTGFALTITYNTGSVARQMAAEMLKRNIESLNPKFKIDVRGVMWASFLEKTAARQMPVWVRGWVADYADAHNFFFAFMHPDGRYAQAQGYNSPRAAQLISAAVSETNPAKRIKLYQQLQNLAYEDAMQIYTVHPTGMWAMNERVKGFEDNPVYMGLNFYPMYK
ncbi:MAG: ABC transporter substrate-binding protein [Elusimicrobiaceae bacterium]|nr:ABC transporter substrate-binding protein [Elusimicrobiaceae bacterium]